MGALRERERGGEEREVESREIEGERGSERERAGARERELGCHVCACSRH